MEFGPEIDDQAGNFRSLTQTITENNIDHFLSENEDVKTVSQLDLKSNNLSMTTTSNLNFRKINSTHVNNNNQSPVHEHLHVLRKSMDRIEKVIDSSRTQHQRSQLAYQSNPQRRPIIPQA
jgi:hypothetical protein